MGLCPQRRDLFSFLESLYVAGVPKEVRCHCTPPTYPTLLDFFLFHLFLLLRMQVGFGDGALGFCPGSPTPSSFLWGSKGQSLTHCRRQELNPELDSPAPDTNPGKELRGNQEAQAARGPWLFPHSPELKKPGRDGVTQLPGVGAVGRTWVEAVLAGTRSPSFPHHR